MASFDFAVDQSRILSEEYTGASTYPDGTSPVRISTEHARVGVSGPVVDLIALSVHVHAPWVIFVHL